MNLFTTKRSMDGTSTNQVFTIAVIMMLGGIVGIIIAIEVGMTLAGVR